MSHHELTLGGLHIDGIASEVHDEGWLLRVRAAGTTFGTADAVMSVVDAMGADGGQARIERWGNAVSTIHLQIIGTDATALALGEAAVRRVLPDGYGAPVDLVWRPPDGEAPASVRTVLAGVLGSPTSGTEWDSDELRLTRTFPLELTHEPHVRSEFQSIAPALPVGTVTVVDDGSSAAGWSTTGTSTVTPTVTSGTLHFPIPSGGAAWIIARDPAFDYRGQPYMSIDARLSSGEPVQWSLGARLGDVFRRPLMSWPLPSGFTRVLFDMRGAGVSGLRLAAAFDGPDTLILDQVGLSETPPSMGKQIRRIVEIGGTERTPGTFVLSASNGTSPLGLTLIHTSPDDGTAYDPDINKWVTSGPSLTPDADAPMGGWRTLDTTLSAVVPWSALPEDTYQIGAFIRSTTAQQVTLKPTVWSWAGSTPSLLVSDERIVTLGPNTLTWVPLHRTALPPNKTRRGAVMLGLEQTAGASVVIGGWYALRAGRDSAISVVDSSEPRFFIEAGDGGGNPGSWMIGTAADGSDAYNPLGWLKMPGVHTCPPGPMAVYVVCNRPDPALEVRHWRRWTAYAADNGLTP